MTSPTASRFQRWKARLPWLLLDGLTFLAATGIGHLIYHRVFGYTTDWLLVFLATNYLLYLLAVQLFHLQGEESGYLSVANQV